MSKHERRTISYLLRLWSIRTGEAPAWRASLEGARTGDRRGFASLTDLFAYLEEEVAHVAITTGTDQRVRTGIGGRTAARGIPQAN